MSDRRRILLVDDDRDIVRGVAIRLRAAGYDVSVSHGGQAGLTVAQHCQPDAIVLDMRMPVVDGMDVLRELRERPETAGIPVIVLSASVVETGKSQALELGARYFLEKPYEAPQLVAAVKAALADNERQPVTATGTAESPPG